MKTRQFTLLSLVILALLINLSCSLPQAKPGRVSTAQGIARGVLNEHDVAFLGIEYARAQRWALPQPGPSWEGEKTFDEMGPACPQTGQQEMIEDCLFLNVFTPTAAAADSALPVFVWIHGGGFKAGFGDDRARVLSRDGIVVVSFNYRLGLLGFRDWPGWNDKDPRNFGQADMVKALQWVNENIAQFGGDPNNVTLAGHSAGGMGVQLMMTDPRARGLFQRAISDAGYGTWPFPQTAHRAQSNPPDLAYAELEWEATAAELVARVPYFHLPWVGGSDLPRQPIEVFLAGDQAPVPYMAGANSYDGLGTTEGAGFSSESFFDHYRDIDGLADVYAEDLAVSEKQAGARLFGDMRYVLAAWSTARAMQSVGQPGYLFYYDQAMSNLPGSPHGSHYRQLFSPGTAPLKSYILGFIHGGVPAAADLPLWNAYTENNELWMVFSPDAKPTAAALNDRMMALQRLTFPQSQ